MPDFTPVSPNELIEVLEKARTQAWTELELISSRYATAYATASEELAVFGGRNIYLVDDLPEPVLRKLGSLGSLCSLSLMGLRIGAEGARALASLTSLTSLDLRHNGLGAEGARALASLTSLTSLNLGNNGLGDEGARALASLTSLTSLNLGNNGLGAEGARALASLTSLRHLDLERNDLGVEGVFAILDAWSERPLGQALTILNLRDNGDLSSVLPAEALETRDARAILAVYRRFRSAQQEQTLRPLNEAKLLVVGNEAVGKTSLIRYLVLNEPRNPSEPKTPGARIHEQIDTQAWSTREGGVTLNVWDFGGQEIMHGTHKFFLTARSLYLLVLEDRREDDRSVYEWLRTIRNRGGDSPVIVVINKCDQGKRALQLDENSLRRDYPSIVEFLRTSCDPGEVAAGTITRLRELVVNTLAEDARLKHVRDPIPQSWLRVKAAVAAMAREKRVMAVRNFERLCESGSDARSGPDAPITDSNEQRALLGLLHDLGVVVAHGLDRDAPAALREITLLDPNWLTGAIYTLLVSKTVLDQGGEFRRAQFGEILDPELYPDEWREFVLDMMQNPEVGLCFELPGSERGRYLIPEALPANEPDYGTWPQDSLRFRYQYKFLPRRLIPRFIVQAHRNLTEHPTRWRTGVVLGAADCNILVKGDVDGRRIDIAVAGPAGLRRSALNVVLNDLEEVHRDNPEIGAEPRVPLPDQPAVSVSYEHLRRLEERYGLDYKFDPEGAGRSYTVRELLEGVRRDAAVERVERERLQREVPVAPQIVNPPPESTSWRSSLTSWRFFSLACGLLAAVLCVGLWLLPSNEWRAIVGIPIGVGVGVALFVLSLNPRYYYRRQLSLVIAAGLIAHAIPFSLDLFADGEPVSGWFRWNGELSGWFYMAWAVVVGLLVFADLKQTNQPESS